MTLFQTSRGASPSRSSGGQRSRSAGFSLLELMIVVGIIAVLATIAYASYQQRVVESRRKAATACLQETAQFMERWYTTRLTYANANPILTCETNLQPFYTFSDPTLTATATAYALTATPVGQQGALDTLCGVLGMDQTGTRSESGTATNTTECW